MTKRTLKKAFNKFDVIKKTRDPEVPGILGFTINGKNAVEVGNRAGYVWVRLRSNTNEVIQAYNDQVSPVYGLPVVVVRDEIDRTKYKIKGRDLGTYQNWGGSAYLPRHGNQHSFNPEAGGGGDVVFVFSRQFMPLALQPSGTSGAGCVLVQPYAYYQGTTWKYAGGTGTASFLPYKPTGSNARMVLVYLDNDSNPQLLGGSDYFAASITGNAAVLPYVPAIPDTSDIPLGAVRLVSGTSAILWDNIYDLRPIIVSDGFIPTGSSTSGHEIQKDGTPLADRAALNFVGSGFAVYNTAGATNVSGTATGGSTTNNYYSTPNTITVLDDHIFKVSGTAIDFTDNISVAVTGSVAFISSTGGGGGGGSNVLPIQDSGAFVVTGTALSFDGDLLASAVGTVGHVSIPAGTFASGSHTHPAGAAAVQIFDDSVFKTTGTAISFDTNLSVVSSGTVAFVSSTGGGGGWTLLSDQVLSVTGTFTISSIPNTYRTLFLFADLRSTNNAVTDTALVRFGAGTPDSGNSYAYQVRWEGQAAANTTATSGTSMATIICSGDTAESGFFGMLELCINEYANTSRWRNCTIKGGQADPSGERSCYGIGTWRNVGSAIDTITVFPNAAGKAFTVGSRLRLYGV